MGTNLVHDVPNTCSSFELMGKKSRMKRNYKSENMNGLKELYHHVKIS